MEQPVKTPIICHMDMNSCYASIELLHRPMHRKDPFVVGGIEESNFGIVLAKNDLAKKYGIKTAETIIDARNKCPTLITKPANYPMYFRFSGSAWRFYYQFTNRLKSLGIDEAWGDMTGTPGIRTWEDARRFADRLREEFYNEIGVSISIGVSYNMPNAKLASDMLKPNGTTVISPYDFQDIVWKLPAGDLFYCGPASVEKLARRCIYTIGDIARADQREIRRILKSPGDTLWRFAHGIDNARVPLADAEPENHIGSIGNSMTCHPDLTSLEEIKDHFYIVGESIASRMRETGLECTTVGIYVRYKDLSSLTRQMKIPRATCIASEIVDYGMQLVKRHRLLMQPIRSIGITGRDLVPYNSPEQFSLFIDEEKRQRRETAEWTMDYIRDRYGYHSIKRAFMFKRGFSSFDAKNTNIVHPIAYNFGA